jgi:hypothetical protein
VVSPASVAIYASNVACWSLMPPLSVVARSPPGPPSDCRPLMVWYTGAILTGYTLADSGQSLLRCGRSFGTNSIEVNVRFGASELAKASLNAVPGCYVLTIINLSIRDIFPSNLLVSSNTKPQRGSPGLNPSDEY